MGITDAFVAPPTALQAVVAEVRSMIQSGTIRPGTQIVQETLANQLGVSRVPIREALRILEGESLVVYSPRRGYFAAQMDDADLADIYQLRRLLEEEATRLAISRLTAEDLIAIEEALQPLSHIKDGLAFGRQIRAFQFALFDICGSARLSRTLAQTWDSIDPYRLNQYGGQSERRAALGLCSELCRAVSEKDLDGVLKLLQVGRDLELAEMLD